MTDYNDGKWHGWNGGKCPVHRDSLVEVVCRDDAETDYAQEFAWHHDGHTDDIIAFRVVRAYREPREVRLDEYGSMWPSKRCAASHGRTPTLFREVIDND
jgi:hypothetical protein